MSKTEDITVMLDMTCCIKESETTGQKLGVSFRATSVIASCAQSSMTQRKAESHRCLSDPSVPSPLSVQTQRECDGPGPRGSGQSLTSLCTSFTGILNVKITRIVISKAL